MPSENSTWQERVEKSTKEQRPIFKDSRKFCRGAAVC
jgi:hypothetical protein